MKRILCTICLVAVCLFCAQAQAQEKNESEKMLKERMDNMRANLKLSSAESKSFWPAYEQFLRSEVKLHENYKKNLAKQGIYLKEPGKNKEIIDKMSDKKLTYLQDQKFELRKNLLTVESGFYKKLKAILTPHHIQDFYNIDNEFKRAMISKKRAELDKKPTGTNQVNPGVKRR